MVAVWPSVRMAQRLQEELASEQEPVQDWRAAPGRDCRAAAWPWAPELRVLPAQACRGQDCEAAVAAWPWAQRLRAGRVPVWVSEQACRAAPGQDCMAVAWLWEPSDLVALPERVCHRRKACRWQRVPGWASEPAEQL